MERTGKLLNFEVLSSVSDKAVRGRILQRRMKAGFCRFDTGAEWYPGYKAELLSFTGVTDAKADDQFDSTAILHRGLENYSEVEEDDFLEEEELDWRRESRALRGSGGVSSQTGY